MNISRTANYFLSHAKHITSQACEQAGSSTKRPERQPVHPSTNMMLKSMNDEDKPGVEIAFRGQKHPPGPDGIKRAAGIFKKLSSHEIMNHVEQGSDVAASWSRQINVAKRFATNNHTESGHLLMGILDKKDAVETNQVYLEAAKREADKFFDPGTKEHDDFVRIRMNHRHSHEEELVTGSIPRNRIFSRAVDKNGEFVKIPTDSVSAPKG